MLEYTHKLINWRMEHDEPSLTHLYLHDDGVVEIAQEEHADDVETLAKVI